MRRDYCRAEKTLVPATSRRCPFSRCPRCPHLEVLEKAARAITHLDGSRQAGDARVISQEEADDRGHRWRRVETGGLAFRVPMAGTLEDPKDDAFLGRLSAEGFRPVRRCRASRSLATTHPRPGSVMPTVRSRRSRSIAPSMTRSGIRREPLPTVSSCASGGDCCWHATSRRRRVARPGQSEEWVNVRPRARGRTRRTNGCCSFRCRDQPVTGAGSIRRWWWRAGVPNGGPSTAIERGRTIDKRLKLPCCPNWRLATAGAGVHRSSHTWIR